MNKIIHHLSDLTLHVFREFQNRQGVVRDGATILQPEQIGSTTGGLPAILWMTKEFFDEYGLHGFPDLSFKADSQSQTGYIVEDIKIKSSASQGLLMLSDFLRKEVVPETVSELDLADLFANFREWAKLHALPESSPSGPNRRPQPD